ncbi:hypothetical protein IZU99_03070 [Oscillospiraceae bacterium CM]|nr:hypothetical protein IZU99_03070 [Oscillospiraceae bacterium CM]
MELTTLILAQLLFVTLLVLGARLERKMSAAGRENDENLKRLRHRLDALAADAETMKKELSALLRSTDEAEDQSEEEALKSLSAEKDFTESIASILGYGLDRVRDKRPS